jgi:putative hydrolase of the HAD superfamily
MRRLLMKHGIEYQKIFDDMLKEIMGKIDMRILAAGVVAYRKVKGDLMEPYPKVIPTLKKLRKKVKFMGIVTDAPKFQAWTRLYEMNLDNCFDFVLTLDDTGAEKPTGIPFKTAMKMLGLRPNEVLVVGDWMSRDIIPANKLGMKTVFAKYGAMWKEKNKADYTINKIEDILKIV